MTVSPYDFTYHAYDLYTMQPLGTLPINQVTYTNMLNGAGQFQGTIHVEDPRLQTLNWVERCHPGRTALFVDYQGSIAWAGVIWTRHYTRSQRTVTLGGSEMWSYVYQRVQAKDYSEQWIGPADPLVIAQTVIQDALNVANSALGDMQVVRYGATAYDSWVSMSFPYLMMQTVGMIVTMMQQMGYTIGFDYLVNALWYDGQPFLELGLYTPQAGRAAGTTGLMLNVEQCSDWSWPEDASQCGNKLYETSTSAGSYLVIQIAQAALEEGYPLLERLMQHPNINSVPTGDLPRVLAAVARGDISMYGYPPVTPTATLAVGAHTGMSIGDWQIGDDIRFYVPKVAKSTNQTALLEMDNTMGMDNNLTMDAALAAGVGGMPYDPRFPDGLDTYLRLVQTDTTVGDQGLSTVKMTFNVPQNDSGQPVQAPLT